MNDFIAEVLGSHPRVESSTHTQKGKMSKELDIFSKTHVRSHPSIVLKEILHIILFSLKKRIRTKYICIISYILNKVNVDYSCS